MPSADQPRQREIRVFISSTFRDMHEEREELVKQIFPQLRRLCENRGVTWGEVDLRWGAPDEAKAEGKVLPLCLAEIERLETGFLASGSLGQGDLRRLLVEHRFAGAALPLAPHKAPQTPPPRLGPAVWRIYHFWPARAKPTVSVRRVIQAFDVFVSHSSKDSLRAKPLADALKIAGKRVLFSPDSLPALGSADYMKAIDQALDGSRHFILFGTKKENIFRSWVEAEWRLFIKELRSGRKSGNFLTVISGVLTPGELPLLRYYELIRAEKGYIEPCWRMLLKSSTESVNRFWRAMTYRRVIHEACHRGEAALVSRI
jgi:hypothetical protein